MLNFIIFISPFNPMVFPMWTSSISFFLLSENKKIEYAYRLIMHVDKSAWISMFWWWPMLFYIPWATKKRKIYEI